MAVFEIYRISLSRALISKLAWKLERHKSGKLQSEMVAKRDASISMYRKLDAVAAPLHSVAMKRWAHFRTVNEAQLQERPDFKQTLDALQRVKADKKTLKDGMKVLHADGLRIEYAKFQYKQLEIIRDFLKVL
jgi:hypothetical protein